MEVKNQIKSILKKMKGEWFDETENLISNGWLSSFELVELICELEKSLKVKIPFEGLTPEMFDDISDIEKFIAGVLENKKV